MNRRGATHDAEPVSVGDVIEELLFGLKDMLDVPEEVLATPSEPTEKRVEPGT